MGKSLPLIYIVGPTAVGKTSFAEQLAMHMPVEMVNMDIGQCYQALSIGVAKPHLESYTIPYHFFDIFTTPQSLTVVAYAQMLQKLAASIIQRDKYPLVVGGSAFYLTSLFFPPAGTISQALSTAHDPTLDLWEHLNHIDPERAQAIEPADHYRLKRALDIWYTTGKLPSSYRPQFAPLFPHSHIIFVTRDRDDLYQRIDRRVNQMMEDGWLDEIKRINGTLWEGFVREKRFIGYTELLDYVQGNNQRERADIVANIAQQTRHYAKRQITFFRRLERLLQQVQYHHFSVLNLTHDDPHIYIKNLLTYNLNH